MALIPDEKNYGEPEPNRIFGTYIQHQPGEQIQDLGGNIYEVTASSTYNGEEEIYDTSAQFIQARSYDPAIIEAIEALGADINYMTDVEVRVYADLKMQDPTLELSEYERIKFTKQETPEFSEEEIRAFMNAPLDVPEGDIDENARRAIAELDIDINEVMQEIQLTPDEKKNGEPDNPFGSDQFLQPRSYDPAIIEVIEGLGANIEFMTDTEVLFYADLKIQNPTFELDEYEQIRFVKQEPPTFSQEEMQALVDAPLDVPEGDITENARQAIVEFDIDINKVIQELDTPDTYEPETKIDLNHQDDFGR